VFIICELRLWCLPEPGNNFMKKCELLKETETQWEKLKMAKRNRVKTVRRQRAIERNLETHGKMTERISRLLEYRNMYNSGKKSGKINIFFWGCFLFLDVILTHFSCTFN
jgi:hypothetical protein